MGSLPTGDSKKKGYITIFVAATDVVKQFAEHLRANIILVHGGHVCGYPLAGFITAEFPILERERERDCVFIGNSQKNPMS